MRKHFLTPRYLRDYLKIFHDVLGISPGGATAAAPPPEAASAQEGAA